LTNVSVGTTVDSTGGVTITDTLRCAEGMTNTLRTARLFRFELFFLADTPICMVNSTSTTDIAMIDIRTGLTIFDFSFLRPPVFQTRLNSRFEIVLTVCENQPCNFNK
jgi:hypothetical protein